MAEPMSSETDECQLEDWQQKDLDRLEQLHLDRDPRGLEQMILDDEYEEIVVTAVTPERDGTTITWDGHTVTHVKGPPVQVGDKVRFYGGAKLGDMRHGWALNGQVIDWETPWERFAKRINMLAGQDRKRREDYTEHKAAIDGWVEQLSGPYRVRIERFRREKTDFDLDGGSYETYPVLMAQRIDEWARHETEVEEGDHMTDEEARATIEAFCALPHAEQAKVIHAGTEDKYGISGHQFDCACGLAAAALAGREI